MASNVKKLGISNLRGKLRKKEDESHDQLDSPGSADMPSNLGGVMKSASSSSIPLSTSAGASSSTTAARRGTGVSTDSSLSGYYSSSHIDTQHMDQDTVLALTQDVRTFSDSLSKLHNTLHKKEESGQALKVSAHERLGDILCVLKAILKKYPPVNSTDLLTAAGILISKVKGCSYNDADSDFTDLFEAIDQLALSFSSSVSEFLMGDMETSFSVPATSTQLLRETASMKWDRPTLSKAQSLETSVSGSVNQRFKDLHKELLSPAEMDGHLQQMESGVELALDRAKVWSKYAKDVITYIEKRTLLEMEFARGLSKLAQSTRPPIMENSFLPFQSVFCTALDQDKDFANTSMAACTLIQSQKFIEPLSQRRAEHEKARKLLRDEWNKEVKKMSDAISNLKKAKVLYFQRCTDYDKAKESAFRLENETLNNSTGLSQMKQVEKKKKLTEEAFMKATEAETTYKSCVIEANKTQADLEKAKGIILSQVRELITLCERTMKAATIAYFQLQHTVSAPLPVQYQTLCENCRGYEPGLQYSEFVRRLPTDDLIQPETFTFEQYISEEMKARKASGPVQLDSPMSNKPKAQNEKTGSESESLSSGNKSGDNSPTASPYSAKKLNHKESAGSLSTSMTSSASIHGSIKDGDVIAGHVFKKLRTPSRCRKCDSYVYYNGMECEKCGIGCHRKCLMTLTSQCGSAQLDRRMTTFGVSFDDHIQSTNVQVPIIVTKCVEEIDKRGLDIKGIYRLSGVKSKVEKLCQSFESGGEVDLSEHHPNVISNVLKLYLRQLPEPLMTVHLYPEFVSIAKEQSEKKISDEEALVKLKKIIDKLPPANFKTAATIVHHLSRVSQFEKENQMSSTNLGIVFGPTLLRSSEGPVNLDSLVDTAHQARAIELLISNATSLFGADTVKLNRQPTVAEESDNEDTESVSSQSSSHRLNSMDSNLAEEIMTELSRPRKSQDINSSDDHLDSITELRKKQKAASSDGLSLESDSDSDLDSPADESKLSATSHPQTPTNPGSGQKLSIYHTQVMRSSSMPFTQNNRKVEKSASTEFKFSIPAAGSSGTQIHASLNSPHQHKQAPTNLPIIQQKISTPQRQPEATKTVTPQYTSTVTKALVQSNNNPLFYTPSVSITIPHPIATTTQRVTSTQPSLSQQTVYTLPDIGAPDITAELLTPNSSNNINIARRRSIDSTGIHTSTSNNDQFDAASPRSNRAVFYTHSMKKKSTEPKFV